MHGLVTAGASCRARAAQPARAPEHPRPHPPHHTHYPTPFRLGCSRDYQVPDLLNADYGEPVDAVCYETAPSSGIFKRAWTKADVQMDCATWTPTITFK